MNRRSFLVAPALAATFPGDAAMEAPSRCRFDPNRVRTRIGLVCATFARETLAFPDPMPRTEAMAIRSLSNADLETPEHLLNFASRWGVNLDWLLFGDKHALIHDARMGREWFLTRGGADGEK